MECLLRVIHVYRHQWKPQDNQELVAKSESPNLYDPHYFNFAALNTRNTYMIRIQAHYT